MNDHIRFPENAKTMSEDEFNAHFKTKLDFTTGVGSLAGQLGNVFGPNDINHPSHYTVGGIEVIDILKAKMSNEEFLGYLKGSLMAYLFRAPHKGQEFEDYKKAQWYLNRLIAEKETEKCPTKK